MPKYSVCSRPGDSNVPNCVVWIWLSILASATPSLGRNLLGIPSVPVPPLLSSPLLSSPPTSQPFRASPVAHRVGMRMTLLGEDSVGKPVRVLVQRGSPDLSIGRTWTVETVVQSATTGAGPHMRHARSPGPRKPRGPARWREWQRMLDEGLYPTRAALAEGEGISRAAVSKGLRKVNRRG